MNMSRNIKYSFTVARYMAVCMCCPACQEADGCSPVEDVAATKVLLCTQEEQRPEMHTEHEHHVPLLLQELFSISQKLFRIWPLLIISCCVH